MENVKGWVLWGFMSNAEGSAGDLVEVECNGIAILKCVSGIPCLTSGVMELKVKGLLIKV
jgi:hypothetical protein